jgi:hypothetical protein
MKKWLLLILVAVLTLGMTACTTVPAPSNSTGGNLSGDLEQILEEIYANVKLEGYMAEFIKDGLYVQKIDATNIEYHLGTAELSFKEAIASEPEISPSAYSLCLMRVEDGADIAQIMAKIKDHVNPMKWVCVGVDPKNIIVDHVGDVIILIMSDEQGDKLLDSFLALGK